MLPRRLTYIGTPATKGPLLLDYSVVQSAQRSFAQPAACLQVRATLTPEPTKHEGRKPRASERHAVGCSEELARSLRPYRITASVVKTLGSRNVAKLRRKREALIQLSG